MMTIQILFLIFMAIFVYTSNIKLVNLEKQRLVYKIYYFCLISFDNIVSIPLLLISVNIIFRSGQISMTMTQILLICISGVNVIIFSFNHLILKRIYLINLNYSEIPWASSDFKHLNVRYLLKVLYVFLHCFQLYYQSQNSIYLTLICILIMILQVFYMILRIMYQPCYNLRIYHTTNTFHEIS